VEGQLKVSHGCGVKIDYLDSRDLTDIRKEEDTFTAVFIEQWTKCQCHSYYTLAQNKRILSHCNMKMHSRYSLIQRWEYFLRVDYITGRGGIIYINIAAES
jgi:hypothetical protein